MIRMKPIIISLCVILVCVAAFFLLVYVFPESSDSDPEAAATTSQSSSATVYIISESQDNLQSFDILPSEGTAMHVDIIAPVDENSSSTFDVAPATPYFDYNSSLLRSFTYTLTSVSAKLMVEEDARDLTVYGLDNPVHTVRTTYKDGKVIELYIGNMTPADNNYYVMTNQSSTVYTLGNYVVSLMMRTDLDYRAITLFPTYEEDDIYTNINWVNMTLRDGSVVELYLDSDLSIEGNSASSTYVVTKPTLASGNNETIKSKVLDPIAPITTSFIIQDLDEEEFAEYGFDNPARLQMSDIVGNTMNLLVGNKFSEDYYYVMLDSAPTLMLAPASCFTWLEVNYVELIIRTVWYYNIKDVESISYVVDDESYELELYYVEETNDEGEAEDVLHARLNGEEISETNARRLYVRTLNFRAISEVPKDAVLEEPIITVRINMQGGAAHTMELKPLNERQYAASIDGTSEFYVYLKNLTTLRQAFGVIADGDELEFSFD